MESLENVSYFKVEFRGGPEMSLKILDSQRLAEYLLYSGHFIKWTKLTARAVIFIVIDGMILLGEHR